MFEEKKAFPILIAFALTIVIGSFSYNIYQFLQAESVCESDKRLTTEIGGEIELIDQNGKRIKLSDQEGSISLIYFGYSYCPDICPYDLERNAYVKDIMDKKEKKINLVFITLDPERDTSPRLKIFSEYIHKDLISLTGSGLEIEQVKNLFKVFGKSNKKDNDDGTYLVDHSTFTYLTDSKGKVLTFFNRKSSPESISEKMLCFF